MSLIIKYLNTGELPANTIKARRLRHQATQYIMIYDVLYKQGYSQPLLKCLDQEESEYVMREINE